ncbi:MAG: HAD family hydrolase [Promethearchaeota archaeon]
MIEAITFDLWNTLFENKFYTNIRLKIFTEFLKVRKISCSRENIRKAFNFGLNLSNINLEKINYRHIYTEERISEVLKILGIRLTNSDKKVIIDEFENVMLSNPPSLKTDVKQTLETLSSKYKFGLVSNTGITPGKIIKKVLKKYNILNLFQILVFSDEIGFYKPCSILFKTVIKEFNCKPSNIIHIGDILETDVKGAKKCNMRTVWINDSNYQNSEEIKPDYAIKRISEVIEIIKRLN